MKPQTLVYGIPKGETERYTEALLAETCKTREDIERIIEAASQAGFHSFRVTTFDGSAPDFRKTLARPVH